MELFSRPCRAALDLDSAPSDQSQRKAKPGFTRAWWATSLAVFSTAAAIGLIVTGLRYSAQVPVSPDPKLRLQASATPGHEAESFNEFRVVTSRIDETSVAGGGTLPVVPASISFSVLANNIVLFTGETRSDDQGVARVVLPSDLAIPDGAKLRVNATAAAGMAHETEIEIPLEPTRCLTFLNVDRPVYRPGEQVFFRSLTLNRRSFAAHVDVPIRFELIDPSGAQVPGAFTEGVTDRGVGNGAFQIPTTAPGGRYTLVAKSMDSFFPEERREFDVRAYRVPSFKKELEFHRRSYGPGERVEADFSAERAEGGVLAGVSARITAKVDGEVVYRHKAVTTPEGTLAVAFTLPDHISTGAGQLSISVDDGSDQETKTKTIPIQLGRIEVDFYAEGGYLVDGLRNRVYFAARNTLGEPVHLRGEILSRSGSSVATVETTRDGMGRFEFTPQRGQRYSLKIIEPVDITNMPKLPSVVRDLPVIDTGKGVFESSQPITMTVRTRQRREAIVRAVCRGQLVGERYVDLRGGENQIELPIREDARGVVRVTVLGPNTVPARPLIERLVYRRDNKRLNVSVVEAAEALQRSPGQPVRLTLQVTDEQGRPAPAVLGVSVVDDAALSLQEDKLPSMRTHFLLTSEIEKPQDLEHAEFYLSDDPKAAESLDLLLGTQGWRRFVTGSPDQPNVDFREQLVRLLELDGDSTAAAPGSFDNLGNYRDDWTEYRMAAGLAGNAWQRMLAESRMVVFVLLGLWLLVVVIKLHRNAVAGVASWLLIVSAAALIAGCSAREAAVIDASASPRNATAKLEFSEEHDTEMEASEEMGAPHFDEAPSDIIKATPPPPMGDAPESDETSRNAGPPAESATTTPPTVGGGKDELAEFIDDDDYANAKYRSVTHLKNLQPGPNYQREIAATDRFARIGRRSARRPTPGRTAIPRPRICSPLLQRRPRSS